MEFFEILKYARDKKGWSQEELGAKVGVSGGVVSTYENKYKKAQPSLPTLRKLAAEFRLTCSQLLGEQAIPAHLLFSDAASAKAAGFEWSDPIPPEPPQPYQPDDQEPGRFLMRVNLEDCELLTIFHQMDSRLRKGFLGFSHNVLRDGLPGTGQAE